MGTHLLTSSQDAYYYGSQESGYYQFASLHDIVDQFMVVYVGEDKLISKARRVDVLFHAQRALQELSYDTLRSHKAQELVVSPGLRVPVPPDFVNYNKLAWVDTAGIEHIIYPTDKTSNPQYKGNLMDYEDSHLTYDASGYTFTADGDGDSFYHVNDGKLGGGAIAGGTVTPTGNVATHVGIGAKLKIKVPGIKMGRRYRVEWRNTPLSENQRLLGNVVGKVKATLYGEQGHSAVWGYTRHPTYNAYSEFGATTNHCSASFFMSTNSGSYLATSDTDTYSFVLEVTDGWAAEIDNITITEISPTETDYTNTQSRNYHGGPSDSTTWDNYKSTSPSENNNDDYEDDTYWPANGERYGLDPQHAQVNGSFYISEGFIYFSSNLSGKTVILKYISDSMYSSHQMIVHKFAEEAIYKWIMYAILSTRANVPARQLMMLKKERRAAMRNAKLRLSNIKLEEITQVLRGKSKQIKH